MTTEKQLSSNQVLLPGEIIGNSYEVIKSKLIRANRELITSYLVRDRQSKDNSLFVLELINWENSGKKYISNSGVDDTNCASKSISEEFFLQQIGFIKKLSSHVQIPKIRTYFKADSGYYIVYEYVRGELLASILNNRRLNESEVVSLLQDVARIYDFAIKSNLVNFNLLPYNILKTHANQRYVLGNLKVLFFTQQTALTTEKQKFLFQSQLHSLAKMLIQCLVKEPKEVEPGVIPVNWHKQINLSPRLQNILAKMIAINESDLYNSFQEIIDDCQPLLKIDRIIGERYRLMRYLGEKNGIKTYLARNICEKKPNSSLLIVKQSTLANSSIELAQIKNRLQQEVTKLQQLSFFEGIDAVHEQSEEELYYVRSYVEGISLTKRLNQQQFLTPKKVIRLLIKILSNLNLIHQQGLIHRNLKPSNIIVTKDDRDVVLVDLGILQAIDEANENYDKYPSIRKPPEQIVGRPTPSSDLYALGIIAIEMLTGLSIREIARDLFEERQIWQDKVIDYPALITIIEKMTCTEVEQRYQSTEEVLQDLKQFSDLQEDGILQQSWKNRLLFFLNKNQNSLIAIAVTIILLGGLEFAFPFVRPQYHIYRGSRKLISEPTAALNSFERALQLQPQLAKAWIGKGNAFLALNFPKPALEAYEKATTFHPDSAAAWAGKGDVFFAQGELERAMSNYNKALALKPEDTNTEAKQGRTLALLSRYEEAFSIQEQALAQNSASNIELLSDAGRSALALGKNNRALSILSRVETTAPLRPYLWQDKVTVLRNLNRDFEALESANLVRTNYSIALEKEPQNIQLWLGKGEFLKQLQLYEKALQTYDKAIAIAPDSDVAWLGMAEVFLALQEYTEALEAVEKTLEFKPNSFRAWHTRGLILQERQDFESALAAYDRAIEINPDFFPSWRARAAIFIAQNNYSEGIKSLQKAIALAPQDIESWLNLSDAYQSIEQTESALDALDKAIVLQPRNSDYWLRKGFLWEKQQEYTEACDVYRQAIKIAPSLEITETMERVGCRFE